MSHPTFEIRRQLRTIWQAGVDAVGGTQAVLAALDAALPPQPDAIIAVGKAAGAMAVAAVDRFGPDPDALVVTKYGHAPALPAHVRVIEAAHPVPDENALVAGRALQEAIAAIPPGGHALLLVSGGASALAEAPEQGWTLAALQAETQRMLAAGLDIHAINTRRKALSRVKGGRLFETFRGARITVLAISDVEGDDLSVIGSGLGAAPPRAGLERDLRIVGSNASARAACVAAAERFGRKVLTNAETLYGDVTEAAERVCAALRDGPPGLHIFGGEPTVCLPDAPGQGGRNQALALHAARLIKGQSGLYLLAAGTDGTDGPTDAAGGFADGLTWLPEAQAYIDRADSYAYLDAQGALIRSGPTGTNVMDIVLALKI